MLKDHIVVFYGKAEQFFLFSHYDSLFRAVKQDRIRRFRIRIRETAKPL